MRSEGASTQRAQALYDEAKVDLPRPSPGFRYRAWLTFQRALDPLARPRPMRQRHH